MSVVHRFRVRSVFETTTARRAFGIVLGVVAWFVLASLFPRNLMPFPLEVFSLTWEMVLEGVIPKHLTATLWRTLWGFIGSLALGVAVGVLLGVNEYMNDFLSPYVVLGLSVPAIAWAAMATLIFGFSILSPVFATVLTTFPYIAINIWKGTEDIDSDLISMAKSFDVSRWKLFTRVILLSIAPALFAATRLGLAISWRIVTIAEMFASGSGIGYKIVQAYQFYRFPQVWAWILVFIVVLLVVEYVILKPLERRVFSYRPEADINVIG